MSARTALITGGTSGIGRATAELMRDQGVHVMVTGQNSETIAVARREMSADIEIVRADSTSLSDTDRLMARVGERFGALDVLFLNAGIAKAQPIEAFDEATYDELFDVNAKGQFFTLQKALPLLTAGASVIVTTGVAVSRGGAGASVMAGSRGALLAMVPSLAIELAPRQIRVNAVSPGAVDTPLWGKLGMPPDVLADAAEATRASIPLGRFGRAADVAEVVAFLASDRAAYVTGHEVVVGGGMGVGL